MARKPLRCESVSETDYKGWVYIYCTKEDSLIKLQETYKDRYICEQEFKCDDFPKMYSGYEGKGKVVARFYCDRVDTIWWTLKQENPKDLFTKSCLSKKEIETYLNGNVGYAIHISQLEIFDEPKELNEFKTRYYPQFVGMVKNKTHYELRQLTKAPQNFCYVEVEK